MQIFNNNKFFPQNFLLLYNCGESRENIIDQICSEAYQISPCSFNSESLCFKFNLRYCPPYEQDRFRELKRLQAVARSNVRFKYEYKGYIVIDISEWDGHLSEELFSKVTMAFLYDMSDCWKYIFISSGAEISEEDMRVLNKYFKIKELKVSAALAADPFSRLFETLGDKYDIGFSANAAELLHKYITIEEQSKETINALEKDLNIFFGKHSRISKEMMAEYLINADSAGHDLISKKDISELYSIIGERRL